MAVAESINPNESHVTLRTAPTSRAARSEQSFEAWCNAEWQCQVRRGRRGAPATYEAAFPCLQAWDVKVANWKVHAAEDDSELLEIPVDVLAPPKTPERDWRQVYLPELADHVVIASALADSHAKLWKRANLSPIEIAIIEAWIAGEKLTSIARQLRLRLDTVTLLQEQAIAAIRHLANSPATATL